MKPHHAPRGRFINPGVVVSKTVRDLLRWRFAGGKTPWPARVAHPDPAAPPRAENGATVVTFVGHVTFLIQTPHGNLLTDPVWSERASPVSFAGPRRVRQPGVVFERLPRIDAVLLSHNHYDHMDLATLRRLQREHAPAFLCPLGNRRSLAAVRGARVVELDWWDSHALAPGLGATLTPTQHWSGRWIADRMRALWGGFVIAAGARKIYFVGDTGYTPALAQVGERLGPFDLCLMPIGHYEPRWFMKDQHMNPAEAVQTHLELGGPLTVGMHFGTFQLTDEGVDTPLVELRAALAQAGVAPERFVTLEGGASVVL